MKKNKLSNLLKLGVLFFGISLLLFSCEKDELIPIELSNEIIPQKMSLLQAKTDNDFMIVSEKFKLNAYINENNHAKSSNNFTIDFSSFYKIRKENYTSYTFLLKRNIKDKNVIENLVVENKNDTISGYIIKYNNIFYKKNGTDLFLNAKTSRTYFKGNIEELLEQNNIKFHKKGGWSCSWNTTYTPRTCSVHGTFNEGNSDCGNYGRSNWTSSSYRTCNYVSTENSLVAETELDFSSGGGGGGGSGSGETVPIIPCANGDSLEQDINGGCFDIVEEEDIERSKLINNLGVEEILNSDLFNESEKFNQFIIAYNNYDLILPNNTPKEDYETKIRKYVISFKQWGNKEFGNYLESLLPLDSSFSDEDYRKLYETIRGKAGKLAWDYVRAIVGQTIESFKPVIEMALWEVGGGLALKALSKLPIRYLTTPIKNVIARLKTPTSTAFSKLKHAKKYGMQSYKQLAKQFDDLGLKLSDLKVERHHLIEKRFVTQMSNKLGKNTDDWLCMIVEKTNKLTQSEHYKFSQEWIKAIGQKGRTNGWTGTTTETATIIDIERAAKKIYESYPEILKALGL